jgi:hypothetical protein
MTHSARSTDNTRRALAVIGLRALDDAHMTWIAAEIESEDALHAWFEGAAPQRTSAYLAYRSALDREEAAAADLQRLHALTESYQEQLAHPH